MNNFDPSTAFYPGTENYQDPQPATGVTPRSQSQRSRFGFHAPSPYPRPRSSASKPNPSSSFNSINEESASDNYYSSPDNYAMNNTQNRTQNNMYKAVNYLQNRSLNTFPKKTFTQNRSQNYSSGNYRQNQYQNSSFGSQGNSSYDMSYDTSYPEASYQQYSDSSYTNASAMRPNKWSNYNSGPEADSSYTTCSESSFTEQNTSFNASYQNSPTQFLPMKSKFQGNSRGGGNNSTQFNQGFVPPPPPMETQQNQFQRFPFKKPMKRKAPAQQLTTVRCEVCGIDFTSQTPYDMHIQGAKHARKLKSIEILKLLQSQGLAGPNDTDTTIFQCEPCNVSLNGVIQFQTHFEGNKHKQKTNPKPEVEADTKENGKAEDATTTEPTTPPARTPKKKASVDASADPDAPPAKMQMLSCDACGITVNSGVQLEQHLQSKKHKAKVEGIPLPTKKWLKRKKAKSDEDATMADATTISEAAPIPDISSSFVKGESQ